MAKFLKKSSEQSNDSSVSSIPVPPSDSALVIDLPEGQKLVLGKMEEGTVIEVATWRGTGRPDSRTNRLMLGVSFGGTETPNSDSGNEERPEDGSIQGRLRAIWKKLAIWLIGSVKVLREYSRRILIELRSKVKSKSFELDSVEDKSRLSRFTETAEEDFDIDEWLASIRKNPRTESGSKGLKEGQDAREIARPRGANKKRTPPASQSNRQKSKPTRSKRRK